MPLFTVMRRGDPPVTIEAPNWIVAMGNGIQALGGDTAIDRLACEMLPNGTVIARDVRSGTGYVVQPRSKPPEQSSAEEERSLEQTMDEVLERTMSEAEPAPARPAGLDRAAEDIRGAPSVAAAWGCALDAALEAVSCEAGAAVEASTNQGLLFVAVRGDMASKLTAMRLPYGKGFVGFCIDKGSALAAHDVHKDPRHYAEVDQATGFRTRAVLCVPVVREDRCYGCLELLNPERRFERADLGALEVLAESLGDRLYRAGRRGRPLP